MDYTREYEHEINLRDLMFDVFKRWRLALLIGVITALIMGGWKFFAGFSLLSNEEYLANEKELFQKQYEQYDKEKTALQSEILTIEQRLSWMSEYMENSVLMQIDPYNKPFASAIVKMKRGILDSGGGYAEFLKLMDKKNIISMISEKYDIDEQYLRELISINSLNDRIIVKVISTDIQTAKDIRAEIIDCLGSAVLESISENEGTEVDLSLLEKQMSNGTVKTGFGDGISLQESLQDKKDMLKELRQPIPNLLTFSMVIKSTIKFIMAGMVLGLFIEFFLVILYYLFTDRIITETDVRRRFGLRVFGVMTERKKYKFGHRIDRWIDDKIGIKFWQGTNEEKYLVLEKNINNVTPDAKKILIIGDMKCEFICEIVKELNRMERSERFFSATEEKVLDRLIKLYECDKVVLGVKSGESTYEGIKREIEFVEDMGKSIMGVILY